MVRLIKITFLLGLLAVLGLAAWLYAKQALDSYFNRGSVITPGLIGKTLEQAVEATKLPVKIASRANSSDVEAGRILAQNPPPGTPVNPSKTLLVVLSLGADLVQVPDLTGHPLRKAKLILSGARLGLGQLCTISSSSQANVILAQYPAANDPLGKGGLVDLLVSGGDHGPAESMPRLVGLAHETARTALEQLSYSRIDTVEQPGPEGIPDGTVIDQSPPPGAKTSPKRRVILTLARAGLAHTAPVKRFTVEFTMPPGLTPKRLDVYQSEEGRFRRPIYSRHHQPGEKVPVPIEGSGQIELEFYVDDIAYGRKQY